MHLGNQPSVRRLCHWCRRLSIYLILLLLLLCFLLWWPLQPPALLTEQRRTFFSNSNATASRVPEAFAWKRESERQCFPASNIAFLKTHKCASSTVQNILFRYAWHHHLRIASPLRGNYFGGGETFVTKMAERTPWHHLGYNIFAIHTKWNHNQVASIMPKDTIYISIVREPVALFESLYSYARLGKMRQEGIKNYLRWHGRTSRRAHGWFGLNQMVWDFGLSLDQMDNMTAVHQLVAAADMQFDFVLVAERMNESLVLLKNLLCWSLDDVIAFKLNARSSQFKMELSGDLLATLRLELEPDYVVYNHFLKKFDDMVEQFGTNRMARELDILRQKTEEVVDRCNIRESSSDGKDRKNLLESYEVSKDDDFCDKVTIKELVFLDALRERQRKEVYKPSKKRPGSIRGLRSV